MTSTLKPFAAHNRVSTPREILSKGLSLLPHIRCEDPHTSVPDTYIQPYTVSSFHLRPVETMVA
jgi:hypothetical protein